MLLEPKHLSFLQQYGIKGIYQETIRFLNIGYETKEVIHEEQGGQLENN